MTQQIKFDCKTNGIAIIKLNRPKYHNAFDDTLINELIEIFSHCNTAPNIRVVLLTAAGKSFSAGADLRWMKRMSEYSREQNLEDSRMLAKLMQTINELSKPTIALVQGAAYGGGVGLLACCDMVLATPSATFCFSEAKLGLIPAVISPYVCACIGERSARRYFLTAEKINIKEAHRIGLVNEIVKTEYLYGRAYQIAKHILSNGPQAVAASKTLISTVSGQSITADIIEHTAQLIANIRVSEEGQAGLNAFLAKTSPPWVNKEIEDNDH